MHVLRTSGSSASCQGLRSALRSRIGCCAISKPWLFQPVAECAFQLTSSFHPAYIELISSPGSSYSGPSGCPPAGRELMAHTWAGAKHAELALGCQLALRRWCHVAVAHSAGGALSQPCLRVYVDGMLQVRAHKVCVCVYVCISSKSVFVWEASPACE